MYNLFYRVVSHSDNIDLKLELGIPPKKLSHEVISNLESKWRTHQYFYLSESKTLLCFGNMYYSISSNITPVYHYRTDIKLCSTNTKEYSTSDGRIIGTRPITMYLDESQFKTVSYIKVV